MTADVVPDAPRWSTRVEWFDLVVLGMTAVMALVTVWVASEIVGSGGWIYLALGWPLVGGIWAITVAIRTTDSLARRSMVLLVAGGALAVATIGPILLVLFFGPALLVASLLAAGLVGVVLVREPARRVVWLAAPAIVAVTLMLTVMGVPERMRFAIAEPELRSYVERLSAEPPSITELGRPVEIGGVPIYSVIVERGQVRLVTAFVGILGDDPAGLIYRLEGVPTGVAEWEHLSGPWYRWYPY